ncbi:MAG: protease inhibitor I42 family protein [Hyphomonadaceae bacterium]|nr:protease inhibitor I42 family protein [Hyphomonadaceae bacterium]
MAGLRGMAAVLLLMGCSTEQPAQTRDGGPAPTEQSAAKTNATEESLTLLAADTGKTIRTAVGESFRIKLETIPTAGYIWRLDGELPGFLEQVSEDTLPTTPEQLEPGFVGGNHWMVFSYRVVQPGAATLTLIEGRPWEKGAPPSNTFKLRIEAQAATP